MYVPDRRGHNDQTLNGHSKFTNFNFVKTQRHLRNHSSPYIYTLTFSRLLMHHVAIGLCGRNCSFQMYTKWSICVVCWLVWLPFVNYVRNKIREHWIVQLPLAETEITIGLLIYSDDTPEFIFYTRDWAVGFKFGCCCDNIT